VSRRWPSRGYFITGDNDPHMAHDASDIPDWDISTEAEFESALETLLLAALVEGLDPCGAWVYRNVGSDPNLEVIVSELAEQSTGD
jgi:hypothetical protein